MKNLVIFRMFLCFPLVGFLLPDIGIWLSRAHEPIPVMHFVIVAVLAIGIAACTIRIIILKKRTGDIANTNKNSAFDV